MWIRSSVLLYRLAVAQRSVKLRMVPAVVVPVVFLDGWVSPGLQRD